MRSTQTLRHWWLLAWVGGAAIGVVNGVAREATYGHRLDDADANRLSALTAVASLAAYFCLLQRRLPLAGPAQALRIGGALGPEAARRWVGR